MVVFSHREPIRPGPLRGALLIDAPARRVHAAALSVAAWTVAATGVGLRLQVAGRRPDDAGFLAVGDLVRIVAGRRDLTEALFRVEHVDAGILRVDPVLAKPGEVAHTGNPGPALVSGDAGAGGADRVASGRGGPATLGEKPALPAPADLVVLRGVGRQAGRSVTVTCAETLAGSLVTVGVSGANHRGRALVVRWCEALLGTIERVASQTRDRAVVVAGVIVRDGAVLAARRTHPAALAGCWEFPGGKVEPGESETAALARELAEELGIAAAVGQRVGPALPIGSDLLMYAYLASVVSGEPSPTVHDAVRWVTAEGLAALPWAPVDAALIPFVAAAIGA